MYKKKEPEETQKKGLLHLIRSFVKKRLEVIFLVSLLTVFICSRLLLVNEHAVYFYSDERLFQFLRAGVRSSLQSGSAIPFIESIFTLVARPGYGLMYGVFAYLVEITGDLSYVQYGNIIISLLSSLVLYLLLRKIFSPALSLGSLFLYLCSMSSATYIRHALPYDGSFLFFLLSIYMMLRNSYLLSGILLGFAVSVYPGIYFSALPTFLFFLLRASGEVRKKYFFLLSSGIALVILLFEIFSHIIAKSSYFTSALSLSGSITQGDFMPAVIFYAEYVFANDGVLGVIFGFSGAIITGFLLIKKRYSLGKYILLLFWLIVVNYLFYELMTFILQRMVLYGRTVRPFYIMNIILSTAVLSSLFFRMLRRLQKTSAVIYKIVALIIVVLLVLLNYYPRYSAFVQLEYPDNFVASNRSLIPPEIKVFSSFTSTKEQVPDIVPVSGLKAGQYYFVNTSLLYPYYGLKEIGCKEKVLIERRHVQGLYGPYAFEGSNKKMRGYLRRNPPVYQLIYCESAP